MNNGGPTFSEADQRAAIESLRIEALAGRFTDAQVRELTAAIWASNTPHELYRHSHGLLGDRHASGGWSTRRILLFYALVPAAMVVVTVFAALAVKWGLVPH